MGGVGAEVLVSPTQKLKNYDLTHVKWAQEYLYRLKDVHELKDDTALKDDTRSTCIAYSKTCTSYDLTHVYSTMT